ncbi:hypothetical protein GOP47_0011076 [Adiantum capillus-veneris]|uniref:Uncharacterized protein n=1 Tax=Adiantum capillus-veneris TaxID=13818 RepID=A0A9D4US44_ADICA|nr:hypothetical protein GOP47_0011076 [Adiantum capillus-veneris]
MAANLQPLPQVMRKSSIDDCTMMVVMKNLVLNEEKLPKSTKQPTFDNENCTVRLALQDTCTMSLPADLNRLDGKIHSIPSLTTFERWHKRLNAWDQRSLTANGMGSTSW